MGNERGSFLIGSVLNSFDVRMVFFMSFRGVFSFVRGAVHDSRLYVVRVGDGLLARCDQSLSRSRHC